MFCWDLQEQYTIAMKIFDEKLSVRETENLIRILKNPKQEKEKKEKEHMFVYNDLEEKIKSVMGTNAEKQTALIISSYILFLSFKEIVTHYGIFCQ